ncbi:hypothetical protein H4S07_000468 [Coemansia furcata]|uniref:Uncharacterized protein n=1 Tax=Coemansia furcata TaxID=417177 RepID=A0ACC1LRD4_9FUNG|nr:hypothetical protein H4S07_000468 [Coemansia furcata]
MYSLLLLFLLPATLGLAVPRAGRVTSADERIIGGFASASGEYPYIVSLNLTLPGGTGLCGGTLITDRVVVTAAHCVIDPELGTLLSAKSILVGVGSQNLRQQHYVRALEVHAHPSFQLPVSSSDIALVVIEPVHASNGVKAAAIYAGHIPPMTRLTAVGWGMTSPTGGFSSVPNSLQETELVVGSQEDCSEFVSGYESSDGPQICTENKLLLGKDTCQGDSGTGVFITVDGKRYLAGLTSYGANLLGDPTCALDDGFGVYTRISYFRSFIDSVAVPAKKNTAQDESHKQLNQEEEEEEEGEEEGEEDVQDEGDEEVD